MQMKSLKENICVLVHSDASACEGKSLAIEAKVKGEEIETEQIELA